MLNLETFSIQYQLRTEKERKGRTPIYVRIYAHGKRSRFSLRKTIPIDLWDSKKRRLHEDTREAIEINTFLDRIERDLENAYHQLRGEGKIITPHSVMARFLGKDQIKKTLLQLSEYHIHNMTAVLKPGTLKNYHTTEKYIKRFLKITRNAEDIYLEHLNYEFIIDFENFLRRNVAPLQSRLLTNNGVMKHLERLKKLLNLALKLEWVKRDPFANFSLKFVKSERNFLTQNELDLVLNTEFEQANLNRTKDVFVFCCYTGLSYIDVKNLKKDHVVKGIDGNNWIFTKRKKTDHPIKIPLLKPAEFIIDKYKEEMENDDRLLPVYSNQRINDYLKKALNQLKFTKHLSFHSARHTFATTVTLSNGVPIETVSKLLGHTKLSTTQIYAKVLETRISDDIGNLRIILEEQKKLKKQAN